MKIRFLFMSSCLREATAQTPMTVHRVKWRHLGRRASIRSVRFYPDVGDRPQKQPLEAPRLALQRLLAPRTTLITCRPIQPLLEDSEGVHREPPSRSRLCLSKFQVSSTTKSTCDR